MVIVSSDGDTGYLNLFGSYFCIMSFKPFVYTRESKLSKLYENLFSVIRMKDTCLIRDMYRRQNSNNFYHL